MADTEKKVNFLEIPCLKVEQPLSSFFVITISAKTLLDLSFSEPLRYIDNSGKVQGSQRPKDEKRLKEIATYIESVEMAFPNSIILAANYTENGEITKNEHERWRVEENEDTGFCKLIIPKNIKLAAIIDGQHRLNAFTYVQNKERFTNLQLVCSVYFDLPNSYQAFLFATINSNQKKVDRSLALDQFGYNVDDEPEKAWTPEKFAVFLSRKLNIEKDKSPFYGHIKVAALNSKILFDVNIENNWNVSMATIVDGICNLISSNPKRDRILMQQKSFLTGRNREMIKNLKDFSPLRELFVSYQDKTIYDTIIGYFKVANDLFWSSNTSKSYINKTVGVQALFDVLKLILMKEKNFSTPDKIDFKKYLELSRNINFGDKFYQASGIGRSRIKNTICIQAELISKGKIKKADLPFYETIIEGIDSNTLKEKWYWEEEAENAVINAIENLIWNYDSKSVSLIDNGYEIEKTIVIKSYEELLSKLELIAETVFVDSLPSDQEFADEQREKFDFEELISSLLVDSEENLQKLEWI
jgi:DNA phosphorothioation-associated DGQHR protein 1